VMLSLPANPDIVSELPEPVMLSDEVVPVMFDILSPH
jgi:hypothetical protein